MENVTYSRVKCAGCGTFIFQISPRIYKFQEIQAYCRKCHKVLKPEEIYIEKEAYAGGSKYKQV